MYSCSFRLEQEARLVVLPEFPLNVGKFLEVLRGWDRPGGPSLRGCHARGCCFSFRPVLSRPLGLLLFRVPSPLSLDWAGFLFWASALEEPGRDPPLPLLGGVSPRSALAGCRFKPFLAEAAFAAVTIAYLSNVWPHSTQSLERRSEQFPPATGEAAC